MNSNFSWRGQAAHIDFDANTAFFPDIGTFRIPHFGVERSENSSSVTRKVETIFISTSEKCNLSCDYCSVNGGRFKSSARSFRYSADDIYKFVCLLDGGAKLSEKFDIVFFGGEPLLQFHMVRQICEKLYQRFGNRVFFQIPTNGTIWSCEIRSLLSDFNFRVLLSIDGPEAIHDEHRKFPSGRGSFQAVYRNIPRFLSSDIDVTARPTVSRLDHIDPVVNFLVGEGFSEIMLGMDFLETTRKIDQDIAHEQFISCANIMIDSHRKGVNVTIAQIEKGIERVIFERHSSLEYCGAGRTILSIDGDGVIYPCIFFQKTDCSASPKLGDIFSGIEQGARDEFVSSNQRHGSSCSGCWMRAVCPRGCHYLREKDKNYWGDDACGMSHLPTAALIRASVYIIGKHFSADQALFIRIFSRKYFRILSGISAELAMVMASDGLSSPASSTLDAG